MHGQKNIRIVVSVCLSVRTSVCPSLLPLEGFSLNFILVYITKDMLRKFVSLKSDKNNRYFMRRRMYIYDNILLDSSYNEKCLRQTL